MKITDRRHSAVTLYGPDGRKLERRSGRAGASLMGGGLVNTLTGMGTGLDKTESSFFLPTRLYYRSAMEVLCVQSWSAASAVDIPVDDMFIRWRKFTGNDEGAAKAMADAEKRHKAPMALREAMRAGRQHGTGVVAIMSAEAPPEEPLMPERIREGDLKALHYFDRHDLSVTMPETDIYSPNLGQPLYYMLTPSWGTPIRIHPSRLLRFDGIRPPTKSGFYSYDQFFGVSKLVPLIRLLFHDDTVAHAIAHLTQEASISVLGIEGLRDARAGTPEPGDLTPDQIGRSINAEKSVYRLLMLDKGNEEFKRVAVTFGGLADLMDRFARRVAAAARIPMTRFWGESPLGMNATGDSDMRNHVMMTEALREHQLTDPLEILDMVLARDAGLSEPPEYEWLSLLDMSDLEIAEAEEARAKALKLGLDMSAMDEDEVRKILSGGPVFGDLSGNAPEPPDPPEPFMPGGGPPMPPEPPPE